MFRSRSRHNQVSVLQLEAAWPLTTVGGVCGVCHGTSTAGEIRTAQVRIALRAAGLSFDTYLGCAPAKAALIAAGLEVRTALAMA